MAFSPSMGVITEAFPRPKLSPEESTDHLIHRSLNSDHGPNPSLLEEGLGTGSHATRDDAGHPHVTQVHGKKTGLVPRIGDHYLAFHLSVLYLKDGVLRTTAKVLSYRSGF